jgi:DNA (cytosine-5)-methyltransferase 1
MDLRTTVSLLPTPKTTDLKGTDSKSDHERNSPNLSAITFHTGQWGKYTAAIQRWEMVTGTPAPAPTEPNKNGNPRLSAAFSQWLMGWPAGWVTDPAIGISRNDQLRIVGNGVVSRQAIAALRYVLSVGEVSA